MIERLPTPWGLVRSGVAPDHLKIKSVSKVFEKIAKEDGFRLFANVELGKDVSLRDLREAYDVVVLAIGSSVGRKLGIAGEDLPNCFSAADFVPWYNAHPDFANLNVELNTDTAIVIGAGNVALDVARMLAVSPSELGSTDIAEHALSVLKSSNIRNIIICGRRGPEHATFTAPEFRELSKLKSTDIYINEVEISEAYARVKQVFNADKDLKNNLETMQLLAKERRNNSDRKLEIKFLLSPLEIKGSDKVEEVVFSINSVEDGKVFTTDRKISIKAGLVVSAIGYETADYSEIKIQNGRIANIAGHVEHNVYVTGWAKRGPIGVIGTNKSDSADVVELIIKNLKEPKNSSGIEVLLKPGHIIINQVGWEKINASEVISGALAGKPRVKEADWKRLISLGGAHEITKI